MNRQTDKDWVFDVGYQKIGLDGQKISVEPYASTIEDKRFRGLTRAELEQLQAEITQALKTWRQ